MLHITRRVGEAVKVGDDLMLRLFAIDGSLRVRWRLTGPKDVDHVFRMDLGESVNCGPHIELELLNIDRGAARLGIRAPKHIHIQREELL